MTNENPSFLVYRASAIDKNHNGTHKFDGNQKYIVKTHGIVNE